METCIITGADAIRIAERDGCTLVDTGEILAIKVVPCGWIGDGYGANAADYFGTDGRYLGPDVDGSEPKWQDAD